MLKKLYQSFFRRTHADVSARKVPELPSLTGIRGIAALIVVIGHSSQMFLGGRDISTFSRLPPQDAAVDLFFVLSGFIICKIYGREERLTALAYARFLQLRFARIWPLHALTLFPAFLKVCLTVGFGVGLGAAASEIAMVHAWPIVGHARLLNGPSWSVSIEWFAYILVFPLLYLFGRNLRGSYLWAGIVALLTLEITILLHLKDQGGDVIARGWVAILRGTVGFSVGWMCQYLQRRDGFASHLAAKMLDAVIIISIGYIALGCFYPSRPLWWLLGASPIIVLGLEGKNYFTQFCSGSVIHFLGMISYSLYLCHIPFLNFWRAMHLTIDYDVNHVLSWVAYLITLIGISSLSYFFVELPARNHLRSFKRFKAKSA